MRIEYESHQFAPGCLLLWVLEWDPPTPLESLVGLVMRRRLARPSAVRRFYAFEKELGRWMDESKRVVLDVDPRHWRLNEIATALRVEASVDQLVGL